MTLLIILLGAILKYRCKPLLVEHRLPIKHEFWPFKQRPRPFCLDFCTRIKDDINRLLDEIKDKSSSFIFSSDTESRKELYNLEALVRFTNQWESQLQSSMTITRLHYLSLSSALAQGKSTTSFSTQLWHLNHFYDLDMLLYAYDLFARILDM